MEHLVGREAELHAVHEALARPAPPGDTPRGRSRHRQVGAVARRSRAGDGEGPAHAGGTPRRGGDRAVPCGARRPSGAPGGRFGRRAARAAAPRAGRGTSASRAGRDARQSACGGLRDSCRAAPGRGARAARARRGRHPVAGPRVGGRAPLRPAASRRRADRAARDAPPGNRGRPSRRRPPRRAARPDRRGAAPSRRALLAGAEPPRRDHPAPGARAPGRRLRRQPLSRAGARPCRAASLRR